MSEAQYQLEIYEPDDSTTAVGSWPSTAPLHVANPASCSRSIPP